MLTQPGRCQAVPDPRVDAHGRCCPQRNQPCSFPQQSGCGKTGKIQADASSVGSGSTGGGSWDPTEPYGVGVPRVLQGLMGVLMPLQPWLLSAWGSLGHLCASAGTARTRRQPAGCGPSARSSTSTCLWSDVSAPWPLRARLQPFFLPPRQLRAASQHRRVPGPGSSSLPPPGLGAAGVQASRGASARGEGAAWPRFVFRAPARRGAAGTASLRCSTRTSSLCTAW